MDEVRIYFDKLEEFSAWRGWPVHPNNRFFSRSWAFFQFGTLFVTLPIAVVLIAIFNADRWIAYSLIGGGIIGDLVTIQKFRVLRNARYKDLPLNRGFPREVTLDQAGLHILSAVEDTKLSWRSVGNISDEKYGIALWLGDHAIPIPDRLLPEEWSRETLRTQVEEWWKEART